MIDNETWKLFYDSIEDVDKPIPDKIIQVLKLIMGLDEDAVDRCLELIQKYGDRL